MPLDRLGDSVSRLRNDELIRFLCNDEVFSDTRRLIIATALLLMRRATLSELCRITGLKPNTVLYHLKKLMERNLAAKYRVLEERQIKTVYTLTREGAEHLLRYIRIMSIVLHEFKSRNDPDEGSER